MGDARAEVTIERSADDVWAQVRDWGNLAWMTSVDGCRLVDDDTRVVTSLGAEYVERRLRQDDAARTVTYSVVSGLPVEQHEATITVTPDGVAAHVTWDMSSDDAVVGMLAGGCQKILDAFKAAMER